MKVMTNPSVNRSLKDKAMDYIDHALGRPADPMGESYRNYFSIGKASEIAVQMRASGHWTEYSGYSDRDATFCVNKTGRKALARHLKEIGDPNRHFKVSIKLGGHSSQDMDIVATTHSQARWRAFVALRDCYEMTFLDFVENHLCGVRLARRGA